MAKYNGTNSNITVLSKRSNSKKIIGSRESTLTYHRDRERIIRAKAFKQLKKKTCFNDVKADNLLTHTYEVSRIAIKIGKQLRLNEELIQAIVLGQSFGCTPFGDVGAITLKRLTNEKLDEIGMARSSYSGFKCNLQSLHILDKVELLTNHYKGLNLTLAVREGIVKQNKHTFYDASNTHEEANYLCDDQNIHYAHLDLSDIDFSKPPMTLEGQLVTVANKIVGYIHHLENALKLGTVKIDDFNQVHIVSKCSDVVSIYKITPNKSQKIREMLISSLVQSIQNDLILDVSVNTVLELKKLSTMPECKSNKNVYLKRFVTFSDTIFDQLENIKMIIQEKRQHSKDHAKFEQEVNMMITNVYEHYEQNPKELTNYLAISDNDTKTESLLMKNRMISDTISVMSDEELVVVYNRVKDTN